MLPAGACVVALVSGGADSTALLRLLAGGWLGDETQAPQIELHALHVNHMLRGAESDADEAFVEALCRELAVELSTVRYDVAAYAESEGLNLEDAGRRIRYRFAEEELDARCDVSGVPREIGRIAVAHTLDDRIETFFMRALTGAGGKGLSSIAPVRGRVVRPLLESSRVDVREWLREIGQEWREDATNVDTERFRALVRHQLVPVAESVNPRFRRTLSRTLDVLADEDALLEEMAEAFARDFAKIDAIAGEVAFDRAAMLTLSRAMARRTIRAAVREAFPEASRLEFPHVDALVDGLAKEGFAHDLPGGLKAFGEYGRMLVTRTLGSPARLTPGLLEIPGNVDLGECGSIAAVEVPVSDIAASADSITIDATGLDSALVVDSVRPGDRMRPLGMDGTRKLSDLLIDAKVPRRQRPGTPVVRAGGRIIWLAGVRMGEEFRVTPDTQRAVRLTWDRSVGADGRR